MAEASEEAGPLSEDVLLIFTPSDARTEWISRVEERHPGLKIRWANSILGSGRIAKIDDLDSALWEGVTMLSTYLPPPARLMSEVRFVQLSSAGADKWPGHPTYEDEKAVFCTAKGINATQIAEWVIGTWLSHQHHFLTYAARMSSAVWSSPFEFPVTDSPNLRMGVFGYGAIGRQCGRLASALGMEVYAYTRSERSTPESRRDDSYCVAGTGDPDGLIPARWFYGTSKEAVSHFLAQDLDLLVLSVPLTVETRHMISQEQFEILSKKKTFLSNVARGGLVNQEALIKALETDLIRGAAIDVTDPEPLPSDHPLWKAPNLFLTPHVSWKSQATVVRLLDVLETNLEHMATGKSLINLVNRKLHY